MTEQVKFAYSSLGKAFEKQTEKQADAIKSLDLSSELKRSKLWIYSHKI